MASMTNKLKWFFLLTIFCLVSVQESWAIKWISLLQSSSIATINNAELCDSLKGLTKRQIEICKRNVEMMDGVRIGAEQAVRECQNQFDGRRWNCSLLNGNRLFGKALNEGTREAAFVHAIYSAGVAHAVTQQCSTGQLMKCGCDRTIHGTAGDFQWAGCSDNIAYGTAFSKTFVDSRDLRGARSKKMNASERALMNLHNNEAGRKVITNNMKVQCKCHGVSGSCELKTCWRAMPSFKEIGHLLKDRFDAATEVRLEVPSDSRVTAKPVQDPRMISASMTYAHAKKSSKGKPFLVPANPYYKHQTDTDLVYLRNSPDFCEPNPKLASLGTHGRVCNRTSKAMDGCDLLCCGRGFATRIERIKERCNCKFHWCCFVECQECWTSVEVNTCL